MKVRAQLESPNDVVINQLARVTLVGESGTVEFTMSPLVQAPGGSIQEHPDKRTEFIRQAAITVAASPVPDSASAEYIVESAWFTAKELWDAKPEDC